MSEENFEFSTHTRSTLFFFHTYAIRESKVNNPKSVYTTVQTSHISYFIVSEASTKTTKLSTLAAINTEKYHKSWDNYGHYCLLRLTSRQLSEVEQRTDAGTDHPVRTGSWKDFPSLLSHPENLIFLFHKRKQLLMHVTTPFPYQPSDLRFDFWDGQTYQSVRILKGLLWGSFTVCTKYV
ncbi:hypothetical protein TNCV_789111 [Trichonephila clavipes]|nr:hypothetical protein TNCV_789111 [Trichonephila clavipes]